MQMNKKNFIWLMSTFTLFLLVGIIHIVLYFNNIKPWNYSWNHFLWVGGIIPTFIGIIGWLPFKIYYRLYLKQKKLKKKYENKKD